MNTYQDKHNDWLKYANQTLNWYSTDSYDTYQYNLKHKKHILDAHNLTNYKISYKFNSKGFRCEEFTDKPGIMFLGGSITQGIGLPNSLTYPSIVAKELGLECWNLSLQAKSYDTMFRVALNFIEILKPKILVADYELINRFELLDVDQTIDFIRDKQHSEKFFEEYYKVYVATEENTYINALKNTLSIQHLCYLNGVKFIDVTKVKLPFINSINNSWARDLVHPGVKRHHDIANTILKEINK